MFTARLQKATERLRTAAEAFNRMCAARENQNGSFCVQVLLPVTQDVVSSGWHALTPFLQTWRGLIDNPPDVVTRFAFDCSDDAREVRDSLRDCVHLVSRSLADGIAFREFRNVLNNLTYTDWTRIGGLGVGELDCHFEKEIRCDNEGDIMVDPKF